MTSDLTAEDIREAQQILAVETARDEIVVAALSLAGADWQRDHLDETNSRTVQDAHDRLDLALGAYVEAANTQTPQPSDPKEITT